MRILKEELKDLRISKIFLVEVNGKEIEIHKWLFESETDIAESDWEIVNKKEFEKLKEDEKEDLKDFIEDLNLL